MISEMNKEKYFDTKSINGQKQRAIASAVATALLEFCKQELEFEQAIGQSGKSFAECLDAIIKGIGNSISDLEIYSKAVKFYFETAEIHFNMSIDLSGGNGYEVPPIVMSEPKKTSAGLSISLDDLLDF